MQTNKKGFTLIELLIVIGILAVLATITVLVLNPAQLFAQARDSQRLSDLGSIKGAVSLYLTSVSGPQLQSSVGGAFACSNGTAIGNFGADKAGSANTFTTGLTLAHAAAFGIDGSGWVAVNLASTTGGSPMSALPRDPSALAAYYYSYACDNNAKTFELDANMESQRYSQGGSDDVESTDGGPVGTNNIYETGTDPGLDL